MTQIIVEDGRPEIRVELAEVALAGSPGKSAYQVAVDAGFVGTVEEWLASLAGGTSAVDWDDVSGKPVAFPPITHQHLVGDIDGLLEALGTKETPAGAQAKADAAQAAAVQRANHTGTQPSSTISDFTEAVQDVLGAALVGSGVAVTYDDTAGTVTIAAGSTDLEAVRDAIGVALVGVGNIGVAVDDAANTITISTTATVNSTDAALRDRSTHTGTQSADTITDGTTNKAYTATEKTKLSGIATGATANSSDATLLARANHTGTQAISTVTGLQTALDGLQPLDSDLTAIAALSTTTYGRALLTQADAAATRTTLGLGTAATTASTAYDAAGAAAAAQAASQPLDSDLTAIAALTTTSYGRAFLALADASAARTALALGTAATVNTGTASGDIPLLSTGGVLPIARLATGTPTGSKFVRDDGTLATPAGGGGGSVATDALFDAKGDLPVGTGADTAAKLTVGTNGYGLVADSAQTTGVKWAPITRIADEVHADTTIVNTTTETDAVSLTLPTTLAAGDLVRLTLWADQMNNSGAAVTYTYRLKIGATTVLDTGAVSIGNNASRARMTVTADILIESTSAQRVHAQLMGVRGTDSWPRTTLVPGVAAIGYAASAEDTTSAKAVKFTVQMASAAATVDFVCHGATLEVIKKA